MGKHTTSGREHVEERDSGYRVVAAEKKATTKKAAKKKKTGKKAAAKKSKAAKPAPAAAPEPPAAPSAQSVFSAPSEAERGSGPMRGIVALWGPLAIIVLLIVVSRLGDEEPGELADRAVAGISSSLDRAQSAAREVVEDVQDALTGGDPEAAAALGAGVEGRRSPGSDLAAAFQDAGVAADAGRQPPGAAPRPAPGADPWRESAQTTTPASVSGVPNALPPEPENPWAPVDPRAAAPADPYAGAVPPPPAAPGYGYGYAGEPPPPGAYAPPGQAYPPLPPGYGGTPQPGYGPRAPGYSQPQAWGAPPPGYGVPPAYPYPPQPYGAPQPYPPGYYPPAQ